MIDMQKCLKIAHLPPPPYAFIYFASFYCRHRYGSSKIFDSTPLPPPPWKRSGNAPGNLDCTAELTQGTWLWSNCEVTSIKYPRSTVENRHLEVNFIVAVKLNSDVPTAANAPHTDSNHRHQHPSSRCRIRKKKKREKKKKKKNLNVATLGKHLKTEVEEVLKCHFDENELLMVLKSL